MPQGARAARALALLSAGVLVATLAGAVVYSRPGAAGQAPTSGESAAAGSRLLLSGPSEQATARIPARPTAQSAPAARPASPTRSDRATGSVSSSGTPVRSQPVRPHVRAPEPTITEGDVTFQHSCAQHVAPGHVACYAERRTDGGATPVDPNGTAPAVAPTSSSPSGLNPEDIQEAYGLPSASAGSGQTIFVVDAFDDPSAENDLAVYRSTFGLPACTSGNGCFRKLNQSGQTGPLPVPDPGWADEISLDLDMVSATCPNCNITLIEASNTGSGMFAAVAKANQLGAKFVSMSWGGTESSGLSQMDQAYFSATGVVYTAASGDDGYAKGVIYPATSNRVVAVGGTELTETPGTARGWTESAWARAGSGCSAIESPASWQVNATPCSKRATTDVSAVADPATGVSVYQTYGSNGWGVYGGTSAATPIIASVYALAGTPAVTVNPASVLYRHPGSLYDITSGSNGSCSPASLCHGTAGWDGPTGLGTPHGLEAFQLGRSPHTTSPGNTLAPGWDAAHQPPTSTLNAAPSSS